MVQKIQNERTSNTRLLGLQLISFPLSQLVVLTSTLEDSVEYFLSILQKGAKKRVHSRTEKLLYDCQTPTHTRTFSPPVYEPVVQRQVETTNTKILSVPVWHNSCVHNKQIICKTYNQLLCSNKTKLLRTTSQINDKQLELCNAP